MKNTLLYASAQFLYRRRLTNLRLQITRDDKDMLF
jgi:hypothetical protein